MVFFKSMVCIGMLLLVAWSQCAPTDSPDDDMSNYEIGFNITETYGGKTDTKDLYCGKTSVRGTHPHAKEACDDVMGLMNGTYTEPPPSEDDCICTDQYDPVVLTLSILLPNNPRWYTTTVPFANPCLFYCETSPAPHFVDIGVVPPLQQGDGEDQ